MGPVRRLHHPLDLLIGRQPARGRARDRAARLLFVSLVFWTGSCAPASPEPPAPPADEPAALVPATFTSEQAQRGERVFTGVCSSCHGRNEFMGPIFQLTWMKEPVGNLFEYASANMPQDAPGSLPLDDYAAVGQRVRENDEFPHLVARVPPDAREGDSDSGWRLAAADDDGPPDWWNLGWLTDKFPQVEALFRLEVDAGSWRWNAGARAYIAD